MEPAELREMGAAPGPVEPKECWLVPAEVAAKEIAQAAAAGIGTRLAFVNSEEEFGWFDQPGHRPLTPVLGGSLSHRMITQISAVPAKTRAL